MKGSIFQEHAAIGCISVVLLSLLASFLFFVVCDNEESFYLVKETGYIHASKKKGTCKFIDQAKERGYRIENINYSSALYTKKKICRLCFAPQKVQEYYKKAQELTAAEKGREREQARKDSLVNSVSDEVKDAIIEDYLDGERMKDELEFESFPDDDIPHGRYQ